MIMDEVSVSDKARLAGCVMLLRFVEGQLAQIHQQSLEWLVATRELELLLEEMEKWLAKYEQDHKRKGI